MYSLIKPLLFRLEPERAHNIVIDTLAALSGSAMGMRAMRVRRPPISKAGAVSFMNLTASNRFGLAAGLDKDARAFPALRALGFGWIEVGTVTPRPQPGNEKPRLFRLTNERALINRMGFNSCGMGQFIRNIASRRLHYDSILGVNIGKNARTPIDRAEDDYVYALEKVYPYADYVAVNVSSPNTQSLRDLQHVERLKTLVGALLSKREKLRGIDNRRVPIAIKLAPDLPGETLGPICEMLRTEGVDGVIATNTTAMRPKALTGPHKGQTGGLSGPPLEALATRVIAGLHEHLGEDLPIIGVGGVEDAAGAARKISAGARAVQCYTAFIYRGPGLLERLQSLV
ncbi:MAG: Dihydroorotate dehydrogenase (quinone) [Gammaproteobacteria bacterium]|nr:Dihydroorotate dehydrogenase (quinone) [Gammaproteobacteria bacterium]